MQRDLSASAADFKRAVWPILKAHCEVFKQSELGIVEGYPHDALHVDLDICAGIDAYQRGRFTLRGITSRIQWGKDYRTFTIRLWRPNGSPTEYEKRLEVLKHRDEGYLYPYWTIQAYLTAPGGDLPSVAVAKTAELYRFIEAYKAAGYDLPRYQAEQGGECFLAVGWERYRQRGNYLFVYPDRWR